MASIGQELKRERELRGISLKEMADSTKINIRFLRALEDDRLDMLPEPFFIRGIIRTYAKYLGLDEQSALNTYLEGRQSKESRETSKEDQETELEERTENQEKKKKIPVLLAVTALAVVLLVSIMYFILKPNKSPSPVLSETESVSQKAEEKPISLPPPTQDEPETETQELNMEIMVQQKTWLEIFADQEMVDSGEKLPGETLRFTAFQEFLIHIGNAGGVTYTLNGKEGIKFGEPGKVRRDIHITLDNYHDFIAGEEKF